MKAGKKSQPRKTAESGKGFADFRELQMAHHARLRQSFSREIVPAIERFKAIVSSKEHPLKDRISKAVASMKQQLFERGVSKDLEIQAEGWGQPINAIDWLSNQLAGSLVAEIEKALEQKIGLEDAGLPNSEGIKRSFLAAKDPRDSSWNIPHWRSETFNRIEHYLKAHFLE